MECIRSYYWGEGVLVIVSLPVDFSMGWAAVDLTVGGKGYWLLSACRVIPVWAGMH